MGARFEQWTNPFERMVLDAGHCFLCGNPVGREGAQEHIFPKWLLRKHNLWNETLNLLDQSVIPYRQLKVPCCGRCNNEDLSELERVVSRAFEGGYETVRALDDLTLFQWSAKVFFALLYKELWLLLDQANPALGSIMSADYMSRLDVLHALLQSVYRPVELIGDRPFSVLVANLHKLEGPGEFDFHDNLMHLTFSLRSNDVGIIVSFEDGNINARSYGQYLDDIDGRKLHPIQFDELYAKVTYNTRRLSRAPKYLFAVPKDSAIPFQVRMMPLGGFSGSPLLEEWDQGEYMPILSAVWSKWGITSDSLFEPPDRVQTFMQDEKGKLLLLDRRGKRIGSLSPSEE